MPVTGPEVARRVFLLGLAVRPLLGDSARDVFDVCAGLASALSEGNAAAFLQPFDRGMPEFDRLRAYVTALVEQSDVVSSVDVLENSGDDRSRTVALDWYLQVQEKENAGPLQRRRETVRCSLQRKGRHWKIVALVPVAFFAPIRPVVG